MKHYVLLLLLFAIPTGLLMAQDLQTGPSQFAEKVINAPQNRPILPELTSPDDSYAPDESQTSTAAKDDGDDAANATEVKDDSTAEIRQLTNLISFTKIFLSLLILIGAWFINRLLNKILDNISERASSYRLFIKRLTPIVRILIWSFALYIVIAGIISPPFETIITISASIGIAVGFASQDILRNIFGGIMIILDRPFQVGDKIQVGDHYGEVKSVGLRSCLIETPDDSIVAIPNGELMNRAVSNANSSALDCQVVTEIYVPATTDISLMKDIANKAVYSSQYLYLNKPVVIIALNEIHNRHYMIKLRVKAYVLDIRYEFLFKSDVTEMIIGEFNAHGVIPKLPEAESAD